MNYVLATQQLVNGQMRRHVYGPYVTPYEALTDADAAEARAAADGKTKVVATVYTIEAFPKYTPASEKENP